jgi:peptidoglycan/LPS O-acetylase OafA/YrhL
LEWTWYLIFPIAVWMFRRFGPWRALIVLGGITIVYRCAVYAILGPSTRLPERLFDYAATLRYFLAARLLEFILGMVVAWWLANRPIPRIVSLLAMPLTVVLLVVARMEEKFDPFLPWRDATYGVAFALMLLVIVSPHPSLLQRFCACKPMRWIGECSYSLYLLHMLVVDLCIVLLQKAGVSGASLFFASLPAVAPAVFLARAGYLVTEAPFLRTPKRKSTRALDPSAPVLLGT